MSNGIFQWRIDWIGELDERNSEFDDSGHSDGANNHVVHSGGRKHRVHKELQNRFQLGILFFSEKQKPDDDETQKNMSNTLPVRILRNPGRSTP